MVSVSVTLSEWMYRAVLSKSVLTLSRETTFELRKPLERRLYELCPQSIAGASRELADVGETLLKKTGLRPLRGGCFAR